MAQIGPLFEIWSIVAASHIVHYTDEAAFQEWLSLNPDAATNDAYVVSPIGQLVPVMMQRLLDTPHKAAFAAFNIKSLDDARLISVLDNYGTDRFAEIFCKEVEVWAMLRTEHDYFKANIAVIGTSIESVTRCIVSLRRTT